ncbi:MAG: helix-turn-helix domain-containing protein, partial [Anaerovorax sp.]|nr:helix-turn-helix domain-containing protein [Anaerovorax sp.]
MTFSGILKQLMKNGNLTPYRLSKDLKVHQTTIKNWLDGQTPGPENIQKVADRFNVSIDFMLGFEKLITCKDCGLVYDPIDVDDSAEHKEYHYKKLHAISKFGDLLDYNEREFLKRKSKRIMDNPSIPINSKVDACIEYFRTFFSMSLEKNEFSLDHVDFETYVSMLLNQIYWKDILGDQLYNLMVLKYGRKPGIIEG